METVKALINKDVDVNIVADKDVMPLNIALTFSTPQHDEIKSLLLQRLVKVQIGQ